MTDTDDTDHPSADPDKIHQQNYNAVARAKRLLAQFKEVERFERTLNGKADDNSEPKS
jgi:hypothetical protein